MKLNKPHPDDLIRFHNYYRELMMELCDDMLIYRDKMIDVMQETGVTKDFDFKDMAKVAFLSQLESCYGGFDFKNKAEKIIKD